MVIVQDIIERLRCEMSSALTNTTKIFDLLDEISSKDMLPSLLLEILADPSLLNVTQRASYQHPNGFTKLVLIKDDASDFQLRLHHWPPADNQQKSEDPHNHVRDFWSVALFGSLVAKEYEIVEGGNSFFMYDTLDRGVSGGYVFSEIRQVDLRETVKYEVNASEKSRHNLPFSQIHSVSASPTTGAGTLFLQGRLAQPTSKVFKRQRLSSAKTETPSMSAGAVTSAFSHFISTRHIIDNRKGQ